MPIYSQPSPAPAFLPEHPVSGKILVAEDPFVGSFLRTVLQRHGYQVVTGEAFHSSEMVRQGRIAADVVITNDPEAFLALAATQPLLYIAANPDLELASKFPACRVLRKPFRNEDLLEAVDDLAHCVVR